MSLVNEMEEFRATIVEGASYSQAKLWRFVFSALIELLKKEKP